jgi:hypothetical protein
MWGARVMLATGAISRMKLKLSFSYSVALITSAEPESRSVEPSGAARPLWHNIAAGARPILDDELLAEAFRQPLIHQTCGDVSRSAGVKADDQAHRPRRIIVSY